MVEQLENEKILVMIAARTGILIVIVRKEDVVRRQEEVPILQ